MIIGVVEDAKYRDLEGGDSDDDLSPVGTIGGRDVLGDLEVRTPARRRRSSATLRQVLAEVEPRLPVYDMLPIEQRVARVLSQDAVIAR